MVTQERLKEILHYDETTGVFVWRVSRGRVKAGSAAVSQRTDGYIHIMIDGRIYKAHRLAWLYIHGYFPPADMDHIDRCPANNSITNLRLATRSENQKNRLKSANNTSGFKGVSPHKPSGKWQAYAALNGKQRHLGLFHTAEAASAAYEAFAKQHHGEFYPPRLEECRDQKR